MAVVVLPFPIAVLLRCIFEGGASGAAVLKLQSPGCRGDVRPVALPAFGVATPASLLSGFFRRIPRQFPLVSQVIETHRRHAGDDRRRDQQKGNHAQRRGDTSVPP